MNLELTRKQISFDLDDHKLQKYYPRPSSSLNPKYYKKAWGDIAEFMKKQGFEHRQYSIYVSRNPLTDADINYLVKNMVQKMPWLDSCLKAIDVTNVGKQYDLMEMVKETTLDLENKIVQRKERDNTLDNWKEEIAKERAKDKGNINHGTEKSHSKSSKER